MIWNEESKAELTALVQAGKSWTQIAVQLERTPQACQSQARSLREAGAKIQSPERVKPAGRGTGSGRPRNKRESIKLSIRLDRVTKVAFYALATELHMRPGALLKLALERSSSLACGRGKLPAIASRKRPVLHESGERVAVCWGVATKLITDAAKAAKLERTATAEQAIATILRAHGYKIKAPI